MAVLWGCLLLLLLVKHVEGQDQYAKSSYYTDTQSDCRFSGFLLVRDDGVVNVNSRNPQGVGSSDVLQCIIKFRPENDQSIMDVDFTYFTISDPDVTLRVELSNGGGSYTLTSASRQPNKMTATGGMVTIMLSRLNIEDRDYNFGIVIRVYKEDGSDLSRDESPVAVGLVVGIIGGIIAFLIFLSIVIVCCYRKKRREYLHAREQMDQKRDLTADGVSPSDSYGLDNAARNGTSPPRWDKGREEDYYNESPNSRKKLLITQNNRMMEYRDRNDSDSDAKDPYIMRNYDRSPTKNAKINFEDEKARQPPRQNNVVMRRERSGDGDVTRPANNQSEPPPPKSPLLAALHSNPRFRASFHENEVDAEERAKRISGNFDNDAADDEVSMTETWNTTFDTNFDDDDRPERPVPVPRPPPMPPVPKSPKAPLRRENTASIRRAPRPSSSSSEIEHLQNSSAEGDAGIKLVNEPEEPPSPSEIVPIRVNLQGSPTAKRKADTQHTLRPERKTRDKNKQKSPKQKRRGDSPDSIASRPDDVAPSKTKGTKQKKTDAKTGTEQRVPEYEGRFKKAPSGRKKNAKSPRLGRSRSTGDYLDEADLVSGRQRSASYNRVPIVTADDYEDSDVESNYNPLRRTGSKSSLYASRSSLYGRRRRKNSFGESVASFAHDDIDYYRHDRGSFGDRSLSRHDRGFKSLGDLEQELRDSTTRSTQTLRECATQTGTGFANVTHGKPTVVKRKKPRSMSSSHTQTVRSKDLHDTSSSSSGVSRSRERSRDRKSSPSSKTRERKNSASSTSGLKPRERKNSSSSISSTKPKRTKSQADTKTKAKDREGRPETPKGKPRPAPKPKPKPRKSTAGHMTDSGDELESEGPIDQSSMISGAPVPGAHALNQATLGQPIYPPQMYPQGYPMGYPPQMAYVQATGQPPVMMPYGAVPMHQGAVAHPGAGVLAAGAAAPGAGTHASVPPPIAPKPASKWDMLVKMTGGESGDSLETGSVFSQGTAPFNAPPHHPPTYSSAISDHYAASEQSGPRSTRAMSQASGAGGIPRKSSWSALKELADRAESEYAPSESNV